MLSVAALIATTAGAHAKGGGLTQFTFGTANGAPLCDGGTVHKTSKSLWAWTHYYARGCSYNYNGGFGIGLTGKDKLAGRFAVLSDDTYARQSGIAVIYVLPENMKAGGIWTSYYTENGTTASELSSGVLIAGLPTHPGHHSTGEAVRNLIRKN